MSVEVMSLVLHHSKATGVDKLVLLGIANHSGDGGAWPTVDTLARYANASERTVQRSLAKLVQLGELAVHKQAGGTSDVHPWQRPNRYDVLIACPITCDHSANHRPRKLPCAPADLWIEGVTPVSPGDSDVTRGVTPVTPGGVTPMSPKPSLEPSTTQGSRNLTVSREADDPAERTPTCAECSAPNMALCYRRQSKLQQDDRHVYRAVIR